MHFESINVKPAHFTNTNKNSGYGLENIVSLFTKWKAYARKKPLTLSSTYSVNRGRNYEDFFKMFRDC